MSNNRVAQLPDDVTEDTVRSLVTGNGCPACDDDGCAVCNSQLPRPRAAGTVMPPMDTPRRRL